MQPYNSDQTHFKTKWQLKICLFVLIIILFIPHVAGDSLFTREIPAYEDITYERIGDKLNITWNNNNSFVTIRGFFYYFGNGLTYTFADAAGFGVTYDFWKTLDEGSRMKFGGIINTSNAQPQIVLNGYALVFSLADKSSDVEYRREGRKIFMQPNVYIDFTDYDFPNNTVNVWNKTTVYFINVTEFDPTTESFALNVSRGYFNNSHTDTLKFIHTLVNASDVLAYLPFEGEDIGSLNVTDHTGLNSVTMSTWAHAKYTDDETWCRSGRCFNGTSTDVNQDRLQFSVGDSNKFNVPLGGTYTIIAWVYSDNYAGDDYIYDRSETGKIHGGRFFGAAWRCYHNGTIDAKGISEVTRGYFVACRYNGTHIEAFVDGVSSGSPTEGIQTWVLSETFNVGMTGVDGGSKGALFDGTIDDFIYINRTLTDTEILAINNSGFEAGNVSLYGTGNYFTEVSFNDTCQNCNQANITVNASIPTGTGVNVSVRTSNNSYIFDFNTNDRTLENTGGDVTNWDYQDNSVNILVGSGQKINNSMYIIEEYKESSGSNHLFGIDMDYKGNTFLNRTGFNYTHFIVIADVMQNSLTSAQFDLSEDNRIGLTAHMRRNSASQTWAFIWAGGTRDLALLEEAVSWRASGGGKNPVKDEWYTMKMLVNNSQVKGKVWVKGQSEPPTWNVTSSSFGNNWKFHTGFGFYCKATNAEQNLTCHYDNLRVCALDQSTCYDWQDSAPYPLVDGEQNFNITTSNGTFSQLKFDMTGNAENTSIIYESGTSYFLENVTGEAPEPPATDCVCTPGTDLIIDDGCVFNITTTCNLAGNKWRIDNGGIRVHSGGKLIADSGSMRLGEIYSVNENAGFSYNG